MKKQTILSLALAGCLAATAWTAGALATGQGQGTKVLNDQRAQMKAGAAESGVRIATREMLSVLRDDLTFLGAPLEGFENVSARQLANGPLDIGFVYIEAPATRIPVGYYTVRASTRDGMVAVGDLQGTVELVNSEGTSIASFPSLIRVDSLDVPPNPQYNRTIFTGGVDAQHDTGYRMINVWIICPNGMAVCFQMDLFDFWFYF